MRHAAEPAGAPAPKVPPASAAEQAEPVRLLVLGVGNVLMGDEGVGVHVVRHLQGLPRPLGCACLDGGTGSLQLLDPMQRAGQIILVDACVDGAPVGTVRRLHPRFSTDYPAALGAHDIGLRDLLDVFYLLGAQPDVTLYAISIGPVAGLDLELSEGLAARVPEIARRILAEVEGKLGAPTR